MSDVNIELDFNSDSAKVLYKHKDNKTVSTKTVSIDEMLRVLKETRQVSSGLLPAGVRFFAGNNSDFHIGIEVPPIKKEIRVYNPNTSDKFKYKIPIPPTLFTFNIRNNRLLGSRLFVIKHSIVSRADKLFMFPYGNIYPENGKICWGTIDDDHVASPPALMEWISKFFNSPFNGDLFDYRSLDFSKLPDGTKNGAGGVTFFTFVKFMHNKKEFDNEILVPCASLSVADVLGEKEMNDG